MSGQVIPFPKRFQEGEQWEPWVTEETIARHYGVSTRTVRRWRLTEGMPSSLFRGSRRFKLSQVEDWYGERSAS